MKVKAVVTQGAPDKVAKSLGSSDFALTVISKIMGEILGAEIATGRPAEFYVQLPDFTVCNGTYGVEVRLTGVSRSGRRSKQFHDARDQLHRLVRYTVAKSLHEAGSEIRVQIFVVIMIDGDVETSPGSGTHSNVLESKAEWVTAQTHVAP